MPRAFRDESPHRIRKWSDGTNKRNSELMQMLFSFASIARVHPWQEEHRKGRQGFFLANK